MPVSRRIYPVRPLGRRGYYGQPQGSGFDVAGALKGIGGLAEQFQKAMAQRKAQQQQDQLNAYANKLENTAYAPRAGLVSAGVNPRTGGGNVIGANVPTAGTAPFSTGQAGMKLQQDFIRSQLENRNLEAQIRQRQIGASLAARRGGGDGGYGGGGNASRWHEYLSKGGQGGKQFDQYGNPVKAGKPAKYEANSSTADQPGYYNYDHHRLDLDSQYSKGTYNRLLAGSSQLGDPDPQTGVRTTPDGSMTVDKNGNVTLAPKGAFAGANIPADEVQKNMARYDATTVQKGGTPRFSDQYLKTQHPEAGLPGGDPANPYLLSPDQKTLHLNAIPPGKWFVDPTDNQVKQKTPSAPAQPPAKATTQIDTGDQGQGLVGAGDQGQGLTGAGLAGSQMGLGDQGQGLAGAQDYTAGGPQTLPQLSPVTPQAPIDVAAVTPASTSPSFDIASPTTGGGLPQDTGLADEIQRSQWATKLQGLYA